MAIINAAAHIAINAERGHRTATSFTFGGVAYRLDEKSINRITVMGTDSRFAAASGAQPNDLC